MPAVPTVTPDGKRVREFRERAGLSVTDLAAALPRYRHWRTIYNIENGQQDKVSRTFIEELAAVLKQPADNLILRDAA